ncbi:serologically defined colon cancer antigen 8 homolog isoform X1 [Nelusetta ayraudi]|uniref:serologically defined colon cancer antigen 8 homolog isoform X1 n=2 Tax=Nelusetta ayraudi TaxID=303726 RepID=UPI003F6FCEE7
MKPSSWAEEEEEEKKEEEMEEEEEEEELLAACDRELRQRANKTIKRPSHDGGEGEELRGGGDAGCLAAASQDDRGGWNQKSQSEAVNQLKSLLMKQCKEIPQAVSPSRKQSPSKPAVNHYQPESVQPLEAEVKFCKEELQVLKQRVRVVVVENEKLQSELRKSRMAEESFEHCTAAQDNAAADNLKFSINRHRSEHSMWKNEMEHLRAMHQAQIEMLDGQVMSLRRDLSVSQKECEELKLSLRKKEKQVADALRADSGPRVEGLCLKCAQHEAVLERTHTNLHAKAVERLAKERDELVGALRAARAGQQEAQEKEWSACLQVKQVVEMAEEANLHKARAEAQCEQLSRELLRHRQQVEREAHTLKERLAQAREEGRSEARKQKEELAQTVSHLSQQVAESQAQQDRLLRDKGSLTKQLGDTLNKLTNQEQDHAKVCVELRYELSQALLKRDEAERELRDVSTKTGRRTEKAAQEVERLSSELVGCRQRLEAVQKDGSQWQAEALSLAEQLANAQRQLHLTSSCPARLGPVQFRPAHQLYHTRQSSQSAERAHQEEVASLSLSAQERQRELTELLQQTEEQQRQRVSELEVLLSSQNSLIRKLRDECGGLGLQLEEVTHSCRSELQLLALEKQQLEEATAALRARCSDMEGQCVQHGRLHQRMKTRQEKRHATHTHTLES